MKWQDLRRSTYVEDRRGMRGGLPITGGLGIIAVLVISLLTGVNPLQLLGGGGGGEAAPPANDAGRDFVSAILGSTEDTWSRIFSASGQTYRQPALVIFSGATASGCGTGQSAMGPFYCPLDQTVYIDLSFYDALRDRLGAPGDFAQAYVIAHEVGHHIQNLTGTMDKVNNAGNSNQLSVALELQADCYAGVWAYYANQQGLIEAGDYEEALTAASSVGDDTIQKRSQGYVVPESFTHGSSRERQSWFAKGLQSGDMRQCNTFGR
jgi:predicted metalloprotease